MISLEEFGKIDMRVGNVVEVHDFPLAKNPSYKICVDFNGEIGKRWSSVQATNYTKEELIGMQVIAVINLPPKNIAGFQSEILLLGVRGEGKKLSLLTTSRPAKIGEKIF